MSRFLGIALALASVPATAEELIVAEGEVKSISPGAQRLSRLEIRKGGTLVFDQATSVFVDTLVTSPGAKIVYDHTGPNDTNVFFQINALDASKVTELDLIGNGKPGSGYVAGNPAAGGKDGKDAKWNHTADRGDTGGAGGNGQLGQHAADFTMYFPRLAPGATIKFSAVGGDGGRGQDGGTGGKGGDRKAAHDGRNGGDGGPGGSGGAAGDAGKIFAFIVVPDDVYKDQVKTDAVIKSIKVTMNSSPGNRGIGGTGGAGGKPGRGAYVGPGASASGNPGATGSAGSVGDGPKPGVNASWTRIDLMAQSAYSQYIAQQLQSLSQ